MFVDKTVQLDLIQTAYGPRTAMVFGGVELVNKMEHVHWGELVQTQVYHGQYDDIIDGNFVDLSRLNGQVVWSMPMVDLRDEWDRRQFWPPQRVIDEGFIVFDEKVWKQLCIDDQNVSPLSAINALTYEQLLWNWLWRWHLDQRIYGLSELFSYIRRLLVASTTLEVEVVWEMVRHLAEVMGQTGAAKGQLVPLSMTDATVETLYLDGPPCDEMVLFALWRGKPCPMFGSSWMFVPE